jgi:RNA-directed DNA polymerase
MTDFNEEQPKTREELYLRIRQTSREEVIYKDMVRLGFWEKGVPQPVDPPEEVSKRNELYSQLNNLKKEIKFLNDESSVLKKIRKERFQASNKKKQENKLKREEERKKRADEWIEKQSTQIIYLGEDVSKGLNYHEQNLERLNNNNLPNFKTTLELSKSIGIDLNKLRFLSYSRKVSQYSHYIRFKLVKKSGGFRNISAPTKQLKEVQYWILNNILNKIKIDDNVHGFTKNKSIVTNAQNHVNSDVIINIDLENFFPTINYKRVKGMFINLGFSENISTILSLICTEPTIEEVTFDNKKYFISNSERYLPQGAPTSPAITNIICRKLDKRINFLAKKFEFNYTRYADDMTFSGNNDALKNIGKILKYSESIINEEGFKINAKKTKILRKNTSQEVTGIVVNKKMNVDKKTLKKFRATLHQIENSGFEGKNWNDSKDLLSSITGYANFVNSINPDKGKIFLEQIKVIKQKYSHKKNNIKEDIKPENINIQSNDEKVKKKWWKLF